MPLGVILVTADQVANALWNEICGDEPIVPLPWVVQIGLKAAGRRLLKHGSVTICNFGGGVIHNRIYCYGRVINGRSISVLYNETTNAVVSSAITSYTNHAAPLLFDRSLILAPPGSTCSFGIVSATPETIAVEWVGKMKMLAEWLRKRYPRGVV